MGEAYWRKYQETKDPNFVAQAQKSAQVAQKRSEYDGKRAKADAEATIATLTTLLEDAKKALATAPKGKDTKAELELIKADLDGLTPAYADAEADFNAGKYLTAVRQAGDIYRHIATEKGPDTFITEVSMDETDTPQTPTDMLEEEHRSIQENSGTG